MTKELKLRILKAYLFYVIVDCRLKFCVQRGFKDIQQEVEKRIEKLLFIKKCFLQLSKEIKTVEDIGSLIGHTAGLIAKAVIPAADKGAR